jgi:hypothetical protein
MLNSFFSLSLRFSVCIERLYASIFSEELAISAKHMISRYMGQLYTATGTCSGYVFGKFDIDVVGQIRIFFTVLDAGKAGSMHYTVRPNSVQRTEKVID